MTTQWLQGATIHEQWLHPMPFDCSVDVYWDAGETAWYWALTAAGKSNTAGGFKTDAEARKSVTDTARSWFVEVGRNDAAEAVP